MTTLKVEHRSSYSYAGPVSLSQHLLRLAPRAAPGQEVLDTTVEISPEPDSRVEMVDFFGNGLEIVSIERDHRQLIITSSSRVRRAEPPDVMLEASAPWEQAAEAAQSETSIAPFVHATPLSTADDAIEAYVRETFAPRRPVLDGARELTSRIFRDFTYAAGATDADTRPVESFAARHGVCQDFAHVMLAGLRAIGVAARYVSGYLRTIPPEGATPLIGADASHAWVSVWDPGLGWIDFDPTNDLTPGLDHVTLTWGRDYSDVAPISGLVVGSGSQSLSVGVTVSADP